MGYLCPGDVVTYIYECTTAEGGGATATVWRGSIFSVLCPRDVQEFVVLYGDYDGYNILSCNGGAIRASSLRVETESADLIYLSQLNVTLTSEVIGKSIECAVDDGMREIIIGSLNITEGMYTCLAN